MPTRVEVLNTNINRSAIRVRQVRVEQRNGLSVIVEDVGEPQEIRPGGRFASRIEHGGDQDGGRPTMLLVEEIAPPASAPPEASA